MIARIYNPGVKFDQVLIIVGTQGAGKSTAIRHLVGDNWFSDAYININDKDAVLTMRSVWVVEMGELGGMRKADVDQLKEFISRQTDRIRLPYGRRTENFPRQCIFIGTTNSDEFLKDETGNRRFWPIEVTKYDFSSIQRDREQLLAEALVAYSCGECLYLEDTRSQNIAMEEQEKRYVGSPFQSILEEFFARCRVKADENFSIENGITLKSLFDPFGPLANHKFDMPNMKQAGIALKKLGFRKAQVWDNNLKIRNVLWK
jgi:predicted P-loop ATPase